MTSRNITSNFEIPEVLKKTINESINANIGNQTKEFIPFIIIFGLVFFTSYQMYLGLYKSDTENPFDDSDMIKNVTKYMFLLFVPLFLVFCYIFHLTFDKKTEKTLFITLIMLSFMACIFYYIFIKFEVDLSINSYMSIALLVVIVVVALMILYNIFEKHIRNVDGWTGFIVNLVFYIPCLVNMFFKFLLENYINTPKWIVILFVCELILILLYICAIPAIRNKLMENSVVLLDKPVMLNEIHTELSIELKNSLANKNISPVSGNNLEKSAYRKMYAVSMWVYINPMSKSRIGYTKESNIFYYGNDNKTQYHPKVSFKPVGDKFMFLIYYAGGEYELLELPFQKWNNLVFNYREGGVDLFVNGELNYSYSYSTDKMPDYTDLDMVVVGDNSDIILDDGNLKQFRHSNGLYGAICNVVYFKMPMSKTQIVQNYNLLHILNPPVSP